ncbi:Aminodeoxyfutalosine synthase [compost metagenome]
MDAKEKLNFLLSNPLLDSELRNIANKVLQEERITFDEGVYLYKNAELGYLGVLANYIREKRHGDITFFNRNFHIEPTNVCVYDCKFCSYSRMIKERAEG